MSNIGKQKNYHKGDGEEIAQALVGAIAACFSKDPNTRRNARIGCLLFIIIVSILAYYVTTHLDLILEKLS